MRAEVINTNKWVTVYHGHQDPVTRDHRGKFFSTDREFAQEYGSVSTYEIRLGNMLDSTDEWVAKHIIVPLEIEDPYDGSLVTYEYWEKFNSETWEMVEHNLDSIVAEYERLTGKQVDTIKVTEGGVENYIVLDPQNMRKIAEPSREELTEAASDADAIRMLEQKYHEFNQKYFYSKLPTIPLRWGKLTRAGAAVLFKVYGVKRGPKTLVPGSVEMVFSNKHKREAEQLIPILLHEMIHVYFITVLDDLTENHGLKFMRELARVSQASGIDVPLTDNTSGLELTVPVKPVGVIIRKLRDGKYAYAIFSENVLRSKIKDVASYYSFREPTEARIVKSERWTKKASRGVQRNIGHRTTFWIASDEDIADLMQNSTVLYIAEDYAYHGAVRDFDEFDGAYVGTGDGALTFGWGIYLATNINVAKEFAKGKKRLLKVELPDENYLLDWDKKLPEQPQPVKDALSRMGLEKLISVAIRKELVTEEGYNDLNTLTGEEIYGLVASLIPLKYSNDRDTYLKRFVNYKKRASIWLNKYGIKGIKYEDVIFGRSHNYVMFDPKELKIIR